MKSYVGKWKERKSNSIKKLYILITYFDILQRISSGCLVESGSANDPIKN